MSLITAAGYLGDQLIKMGIASEEQINEALRMQELSTVKGKKAMLGQILISMGYCLEEDIARALSQKSGFDYLSINNSGLNMAYANLITPEIAMKYKAIPIGMEEGKLHVAMLNPNDIIAIDDLRLLTGHEIKPVVVPDKELKTALDQFSNISKNVEEQKEPEDEEEKEGNELANLSGDEPASQRPAVQLVNQIINQASRMSASDIHIEPQERYIRIRFRIDGVLHEIMQQPVRMHPVITSRIKVMAGLDIAERRIPQDGRITLRLEDKSVDIRVATLPSAFGEKITLRLLNRSSRIITLGELGFPEFHLKRYEEVMRKPYGFVLITGPTGSGKSTSLYATLAAINSPDKNIITLEDPIERRLEGLNQIQVNLKAGITFASGLRSILRSDPDIIMVGEIRDKETAKIAVESALTGHLVFSTLHTNDSAGAITRLEEMGVEPFLTASSLAGVVAQRLVRVLCPTCKTPYSVSRGEILKMLPGFPIENGIEELTLYKPKGCLSCNHTGYKGRLGVYEYLYVSEQIRQLILHRASVHEIRSLAVEQGMASLRRDGMDKVKKGITSVEEILRVIL